MLFISLLNSLSEPKTVSTDKRQKIRLKGVTVLCCFLEQLWISFHNARVYLTVSVSEVMQVVAQGLEEEEGEQHLGRGEGRRLHQDLGL